MLNAFKLIWNFSSKRKKEYRNAIIFLFSFAADMEFQQQKKKGI